MWSEVSEIVGVAHISGGDVMRLAEEKAKKAVMVLFAECCSDPGEDITDTLSAAVAIRSLIDMLQDGDCVPLSKELWELSEKIWNGDEKKERR